MKNLVLFILLIGFGFTSLAQKKSDILDEINDYKRSIVANESYDNSYSEIWDAIYIIATEEYNTIVRESESKGYIEAKQETNTFKEYMTIEIRGEEAPYRVSFQVKQEKRSKRGDGTYSNWEVYTSSTLRSYYLKLQIRLYELLKGKLDLSDELLKKIDDFNSTQKKDKHKIVKGRDY